MNKKKSFLGLFKNITVSILILCTLCSGIVMVSAECPEFTVEGKSACDQFDGAARAIDFYMYGNNPYYSWVEYDINVDESGIYSMVMDLAVSQDDAAEVRIVVDNTIMSKNIVIPKDSDAWKRRSVKLSDSLSLSAGNHKLRIYQTELKSHLLIYEMIFTYVAEYKDSTYKEFLVSQAEASSIDSSDYSNRGNFGGEIVKFKSGNEISFNVNIPTGAYDISVLVSTSEEQKGRISAFLYENNITSELEVPANYSTDMEAKDGEFYELNIASDLLLGSGDNIITLKSIGEETDSFYIKSISVTPAEKSWLLNATLEAFNEAEGNITANIDVQNNYEANELNLVLAIVLYNSKNKIIAYHEKPFTINSGEKITDSFTVPIGNEEVKAKAFVWGGNSLYESDMNYYCDVIESLR